MFLIDYDYVAKVPYKGSKGSPHYVDPFSIFSYKDMYRGSDIGH